MANSRTAWGGVPIRTDAEKRTSLDCPRCLNCKSGSADHYVHLGRNSNPNRLDGYVGDTWELRCDICSYGVSPDVPLTDKAGRLALENTDA